MLLRYVNISVPAIIYTYIYIQLYIYLHAHSDHPKSLKISTPYSQALRIKTIRSTLTKYKKCCAILKQKFIGRGYEENILKDEIDKVDNIDRQDLLRKKEKNIKDRIPCLIT